MEYKNGKYFDKQGFECGRGWTKNPFCGYGEGSASGGGSLNKTGKDHWGYEGGGGAGSGFGNGCGRASGHYINLMYEGGGDFYHSIFCDLSECYDTRNPDSVIKNKLMEEENGRDNN